MMLNNVATGGTMTTVPVRELKNRLSEYLRKVKAGERVLVTERGKAVAVISTARRPVDEGIEAMVREGAARWGGGKPRGARRPVKIKGPSVAQAVIEDRRR
jgi:prevent-host-death family protein